MTSKKKIDQTWDKAKPIRGKNPDDRRKDAYGNEIRHASFGTLGDYGWEIDQPLHWEENREKGDTYPYKKKKK